MSTPQRYRRGLVVGKFSPLHLGHELLIQTAQARCDELLLLSYSQPEFPRCDAATRAHWLQLRFPAVPALVLDDAALAQLCRQRGRPLQRLPANDAPDEVQRRFVGEVLIGLLGLSVDAVFTSEHYGDGFAASLTAQLRAVDPQHAGVTHVCVDLARRQRPVSGTAIRARAPAWQHALAAEVYADLVPRVCLLGGESSGKTTLARALAEALGSVWVAEYGRERWLALGGRVMSADELVQVAQTQVQHEISAAPRAQGWLVCDTSPLTTLQYCLLDHGQAPARLQALARRRYDLAVLCAADFGFVQDGTRRNADFSARQQARTEAALIERGQRYLCVSGSVAARVDQVRAALDTLEARSGAGFRPFPGS